jgi:molecular chaperone DnaK (HSP70)
MTIAIDFGTTYTGVAYYSDAANSQLPHNERHAKEIAEKVIVIKDWPKVSVQFMEKTPTIIAYHTDPPTWGGSVKPQDEPQISRFKLGLEPAVPRHYSHEANHEDSTSYGRHDELPHKEPVDFATDFLKCIHKYIQNTHLPRQYGAQFLRNQRIAYVVTVPAIWGPKAQALTLEAASKAFETSKDELTLVPEPEAAALFCATTCEEVDLTDGDQFLLCDAGGGTVVHSLQFSKINLGSYFIHNTFALSL